MIWNEVVTIFAVLIAPLLAVQVQKWLETYRERRERKLSIFKTLMATRATALSPDHVRALNLIDLEFLGSKHKAVREKWREYLDHLGNFPKGENIDSELPIWRDRSADNLANLLMEMGKSLGYDFDVVHVKKGIYLPEGHSTIEKEQELIRKSVLHLLLGKGAINMSIKEFPVDPDALDAQKKLTETMLEAMKSNDSMFPVVFTEKQRSEN